MYPEPTPNAAAPPADDSLNDLAADAIAAALSDRTNTGFYRSCLRRYPLKAIRVAFQEAVTLPEARIRKSRGAYFNYLVKRIAADVGPDPPGPAP
jgi:hypothetical protein